MKQSKYLITGDDISEMGLSLLPGKEHLSGKKTLTKLEIISTYYATVSGIDDDDRCVTYERVTPSVYLEINKTALSFLASGGTDTITLDTNLSSDQISVNHSSSRFSVTKNSNNTITVKANNLGTTVYSQVNDTLTISGGGITRTCSLSQEANEKEYGSVSISGGTVEDIPASGGTVSEASGITASQIINYTSGAQETIPITDIRFPDSVSAYNLGTTIKARTFKGAIHPKAYGEGGYVRVRTLSVYQEANEKEYGDLSISSFSYSSVSASGGTSTPTVGSIIQSISYTSGATDSETVTSASKSYAILSSVSGASINTTSGVVTWTSNESMSSRTVTVRLTVSANNKTATEDAACMQNAGVKTYANPIVTLSYPIIPASGGTVYPTISYSQTWGWNGATTGGDTITSGGNISYSGTSVNTSNGSVSANSKGTVVSGITNVTTATAKVTLNGKNGSNTYTVQQEANQIEEKFLDLPNFNTTVNLEWSPDMVNMQSYLGNVYKKESYTSDAISAGTLIGIAGTHPAIVKDPTIINQDSGMNIRPSAYMLIIDDNTSNTQKTAVLEWEITDSTGEYDSFIKRMTIIQAGKPISVGYGSLALTTSAGMFPPYVSNYKIDFRSSSTGTLIESCTGSPSILTGQIPILQNITDSVVNRVSLGGTYLSVTVELSNADTGEGSLSPVLYSGVLSGSDIQSLKNGTDKVLIVS